MKVLMLGWEFPPRITGGLGTACQGLVRGLTAQGVEVLFVLPRAHGDQDAGGARLLGSEDWQAARRGPSAPVRVVPLASPLAPYTTASQYAQTLARCRPACSDGEASGARSHLADSQAYAGDLFAEVERFAAIVAELAREEDFDLVHAHDWMTFPAGLAAARARGRPLVAHVHACEYDRCPQSPDERIARIERDALHRADRVVCVSAYTAGVLQRRYGVAAERLRVVHNAVEPRPAPAPHRPRPADGTPLVLFLGRVTLQKGPEYFLEAAARVLELEPRARFVISGTGDLLPSVIERAAELGLARRVRFTGFLERAEVERVLARADVLVMPSVSEPFGIVPLEALARGVPVIVSRQSGVAEVLEGALKVDHWDVDELANKILAVLRRPALRRTLGESARADLSAMSWEARGQRLRGVFAEVLA